MSQSNNSHCSIRFINDTFVLLSMGTIWPLSICLKNHTSYKHHIYFLFKWIVLLCPRIFSWGYQYHFYFSFFYIPFFSVSEHFYDDINITFTFYLIDKYFPRRICLWWYQHHFLFVWQIFPPRILLRTTLWRKRRCRMKRITKLVSLTGTSR